MRHVEPRPAATVVVARPADEGVEVLILRRAAATSFAPGFVVFPGGLIDEADRGLAVRLFGDPHEAARACSLRELYEETGLLLTAGGLEERRDGAPLDRIAFEPPAAAALVEMARWVAPEFLEVRFDARFFAVEAPSDVSPRADGVEIEEARWARPEEVLAESVRGDAPLMWPTLVTLEALADCTTVAEVLALRVPQIEPGRADRPATVRGAWRRPEGFPGDPRP